jgi:hypothetical protein
MEERAAWPVRHSTILGRTYMVSGMLREDIRASGTELETSLTAPLPGGLSEHLPRIEMPMMTAMAVSPRPQPEFRLEVTVGRDLPRLVGRERAPGRELRNPLEK